jgi:hypothetical protein
MLPAVKFCICFKLAQRAIQLLLTKATLASIPIKSLIRKIGPHFIDFVDL